MKIIVFSSALIASVAFFPVSASQIAENEIFEEKKLEYAMPNASLEDIERADRVIALGLDMYASEEDVSAVENAFEAKKLEYAMPNASLEDIERADRAIALGLDMYASEEDVLAAERRREENIN